MVRVDADQVKQRARGQWPQILQRLAGLDGRQLENVHQPCPVCGGKDRYRFDDQDGDGSYFCNQCGAGDGLSLLQKATGWDFPEALREVARMLGFDVEGDAPPPLKPRDIIESKPEARKRVTKTPIVPVPDDAPDPDFVHWRLGKASSTWTYRDAEGLTLFHVCRFDHEDGRKEVLPYSFCSISDGKREWSFKALAGTKRPLYGLDRLARSSGKSVLIVEGEKAADAAQALLGIPVLTWPGGSKARAKVDWEPLRGFSVAVWPDADQDGHDAVVGKLGTKGKWQPGLVDLLRGIAEKVQMVRPPADVSRGWDLADAAAAGWSGVEVMNHLQENLSLAVSAKPAGPEGFDPADPAAGKPKSQSKRDAEIRPLGYNAGIFYYLPASSGQVVGLTPANHRKAFFISLAPLQWWERHFPGDRGPDWDAAANKLMRSCERMGVYDSKRIRGRGCWWESDRVIMHLGDRLLVDGAEVEIADHSTRYIYEAAASVPGPAVEPLTDAEAGELFRTAEMMRWDRPASAALLCGWIVLAPICGAIRWRPHVWITGGAGSGKTTIASDFVRPLIGDMGYHVQGETTEAGVRQMLGSDSMPILFDEAEQNERRDNARIQMVLSLMRQSSSESGAVVVKGSAGGVARSFDIRSSFCLISIATGIKQHADATRISVLGLQSVHATGASEKAASQSQWDRLRERLDSINPDVGRRLVRRTVNLLPVIRHNAEVFSRVAAYEFGNQRIGDQYGFLLAGAASMLNSIEYSDDEALSFIKSYSWDEYVETSQERDEEKCLAHIMQYPTMVDGKNSKATLLVGELVAVCMNGQSDDGNITPQVAKDHLFRFGLRMEGKNFDSPTLLVSNTAEGLKKILRDTAWAANWAIILRRLDGAGPCEKLKWFGSGVGSTRAVEIPLRTGAVED